MDDEFWDPDQLDRVDSLSSGPYCHLSFIQ